jgi:ASC-1-like (ASCH) protein
MARRCAKLSGYSAFIAKAREFEREAGDKTEAMKAAMRDCREHDILKEFLETHGTEVINMLLTEWKMEDALAVRYEEGWTEGREEGWSAGRIEIAKSALIKDLPLDTISAITKLNIEDIKRLAAHQ